VPNWGATIVGARKFLIAYNVNLLSTKEQAHRVALDIREQGRGTDQVGTPTLVGLGQLAECKWQYIDVGVQGRLLPTRGPNLTACGPHVRRILKTAVGAKLLPLLLLLSFLLLLSPTPLSLSSFHFRLPFYPQFPPFLLILLLPWAFLLNPAALLAPQRVLVEPGRQIFAGAFFAKNCTSRDSCVEREPLRRAGP